MGLVPDTYIFEKTANGNVNLIGYKNSAVVELYSLGPVRDIRISQSYPQSIIIPVDSIGNHVDNKFVSIPWTKIDFSASTPVVSPLPTNIFEAVQALGSSFFLLPVTDVIARHDWQPPYSYMGSALAGTAESDPDWLVSRIEVFIDGTTLVKTATGSWDDRYILPYA